MRTPRALLIGTRLRRAGAAAVQGLTGMQELVFYAGPFLLLLGLLLSGRFIGEDAILARRAVAAAAAAGLAALDAGARAPARLAAGAQHAAAPRPAGRAAAPRLNRPRSSSRRRSRCGPSPAPSRRPRCCSPRPSRSPTRATPTTAPSSRRSRPHVKGVDVSVLNFDDRLLLHNTSGQDVDDLRLPGRSRTRSCSADGTVEVNTNSEAYYLNEDRLGETAVPKDLPARAGVEAGLQERRASSGTTIARTGWARATRRSLKDKDVRHEARRLGGPDRRSAGRRARSPAR